MYATKVVKSCVVVFVVSSLLLSPSTDAQTDPCTTSNNIGDPRRSELYVPSPYEANLCDDFTVINRSLWYKMSSYNGNAMYTSCPPVNHCGTAFPIWLNGALPTASNPGPITVPVCSPDYYGDCCQTWQSTIKVKWCTGPAGDFYVYNLQPVPACDMAYCVGDGLVCSSGEVWNAVQGSCVVAFPQMTQIPVFAGPFYTTGGPIIVQNFFFTCSIGYTQMSEDNGARFDVSLLFNGVAGTTITVNATSPMVVTFTSSAFKGNVGQSVSCQVQSYWASFDSQVYMSAAVASSYSYWVGITYETFPSTAFNPMANRIEFDQTVNNVTILFYSTISCCKFSIYLLNAAMKQSTCEITIPEASFDLSSTTNNILVIKSNPSPGTGLRTGLLTFSPVPTHIPPEFWDGYQMQDIPVYIVDDIPSRVCTVSGDPHFTTFDGNYYHSFFVGDFILFRSPAPRGFRIHIRQKPCNNFVTCICALAVREGNNILGVFACDEYSAPTPIIYLRDPNVPGAEITVGEVTSGSQPFNISMPSGAYVTVVFTYCHVVDSSGIIYNTYVAAVTVYALEEDMNIPLGYAGLCGNYDGNPDNDLTPLASAIEDTNTLVFPASLGGGIHPYPETFVNSYRLQPTVSLINGYIFPPSCVLSTANVPYVCGCNPSTSTQSQYGNCTAPANNSVFITTSIDACNNYTTKGRKKRSTTSLAPDVDNIIYPDDIPLETFNDTLFNWLTATTSISYTDADSSCRTPIINLPIYPLCQNYVDITNMVQDCAVDLCFYDNINMTAGIVEIFEQQCVFNVMASENTSDPNSVATVQQLLQNIQNQICPGQCSGHGTCTQGQCVCNTGYLGGSCSVVVGVAPVLTGFRKGQLCDARQSACAVTFVFVTGFYSSSTLTCRVTSTVNFQQTFYTQASIISGLELQCVLPTMSPIDPNSLYPVYYWNIAVSNNGVLFSNSLPLTVFDSLCESCTSVTTCRLQENTCLISGTCYAANDVDSSSACWICNPAKSTTAWSFNASTSSCVTSPTTTTTAQAKPTTTSPKTTTSHKTTTSPKTTSHKTTTSPKTTTSTKTTTSHKTTTSPKKKKVPTATLR